MSRLSEIFSQFSTLKVLVVGDVMLDSYLWGATKRISPEAPVPIVEVVKREKRLGGAANVALNIKAMGADPIMLTVVGKDVDGSDFYKLCENENMITEGVIDSASRVTTIKHRIISTNQHILRVDQEQTNLLCLEDENKLLFKAAELILGVDVVIFQDYDKGVISPRIIREISKLANNKGIPVAVDPKKRNFSEYKNIDLFKPNLKELIEGTNTNEDLSSIEGIKKVVSKFKEDNNQKGVMVTLSERGVLINKEEEVHHPAHLRTITDVSGAGDTVISLSSLALGLGLSGSFTAALSNLSGGLVCEKVVVVPVDKDNLLMEAEKHHLDRWL